MDDLDAHIVELESIPKYLDQKVWSVVSKGANNIKKDWAARWRGHSSIRHLPRSLSYDLHTGSAGADAEIGPDPSRMQGNLAHFIEFGNAEYGSVRNAPIPGGLPALAAEEPRFVKALADLGEKAPVGDGVG